jgi:plastocyanin
VRNVRRQGLSRAAVIVVAGLLVSCGQTTTTSLPPPVNTKTITITAAGADPRNIIVSQGDRVLFINNDTRSHNMSSDPHPEHTDCPEINQAGFLTPGQQRETGNLVVARSCGFHDHDLPQIESLRGQITIK